jgi:putative endonuclease
MSGSNVINVRFNKILDHENNCRGHANRNSLSSYDKGISAELCAKKYLTSQGYEIIGQRIRNEYGEIDLLAKRGNDVVACEVKQRKTLWSSRDCLTKRQKGRIARAFSLVISGRNEIFENYRIDVVCFDIHGRIEHIENAFYIEEVA